MLSCKTNRCWSTKLLLRHPLLLVGCLVASLLASEARAWQGAGPGGARIETRQQRELENWPYRFDLFQMLFEQNELKPVQSMNRVLANPKGSVVVVMGGLSEIRQNELMSFMANGGNILFASDLGYYFPRYFRIRTGPVKTNDPAIAYAGFDDCIRVTDLVQDHPLCKDVSEVILNQSGWIDQLWRDNSKDIVARIGEVRARRTSINRAVLLAMRENTNTGARIIVCADQSLFSNGMMWHGDNARLAVNVCEQLCEGGRKQVLFLVNGKAQPSYLLGPIATELPLPEQTPELSPEQMLAVANAVLTDVEDQDLFNAALRDRPRNLSQQKYIRAILFAIVAGLGALMLRQFLLPGTTLFGPLVPPRTNLRIRSKNAPPDKEIQLRSPESWQVAARMLSEEFCEEVTSSSDPAVWARELSGPLNSTKLASLPRDDKVNLFLRRVVQLATQNSSEPITSDGLIALRGDLAELRRTLAEHEANATGQVTG